MSAAVFTGTLYHTLKETLRDVLVDGDDETESKNYMKRMFDEGTMADNYEDVLETAGPAYASAKTEGAQMTLGTVQEGVLTRYIPTTFAIRLMITREALEDVKYKKAINMQKRNKTTMWRTVDQDATLQFIRGFDSTYPIGDGLPLFSTGHLLAQGGTFSNSMSVALSPSRAAMISATSSLMALPGHDGTPVVRMPKKIVCPVGQWAVWQGIVRSAKVPESNANEINVVNQTLEIDDIIANPFWVNTTTNWAVITDAPGLRFLFRRRPSGDDWVENSQQLSMFAYSARWARNCEDPRSCFGVNA